MNPTEFFNSLPEQLQIALAVSVTENTLGTTGFPELREVAAHVCIGTPLEAKSMQVCQERTSDWISDQLQLQEIAIKTIGLLMDSDPITTDALPEWRYTDWGQDLYNPWSDDIALAIVMAKEELNG
jgi:hypothetical protein